jgi:hypothetical protein
MRRASLLRWDWLPACLACRSGVGSRRLGTRQYGELCNVSVLSDNTLRWCQRCHHLRSRRAHPGRVV